MDKYLKHKRSRSSRFDDIRDENSDDELIVDDGTESRARKAKLRKYDPVYLTFGFIPYKAISHSASYV